MDPVTIALLVKLSPYLLQGAVQLDRNLHQDILGAQQVQIAYYRATEAYWKAQQRCCCRKKK